MMRGVVTKEKKMFNFDAEWLNTDLSEIPLEQKLFKNPDPDCNKRSSDYAVVITRWEDWGNFVLVGCKTAGGKHSYHRYESIRDVNDFVRLELNPKSMGEASYRKLCKNQTKSVFSLL